MRCISRITLSLFAIAIVATVSGCAFRWSREEGLCMKPLFRVRVQLNRFDDTGNGAHGAQDCCIEGGVIDGGVLPGGVVPGGVVPDGGFVDGGVQSGFGTAGPLTVETEPLGGPILPPDGSALAGGFLSGSSKSTPVFGPNATVPPTTPPASTSGTSTQQTAKKRPGSLNVKTGLQLDHAQPGTAAGQNPSLRVGQRTVFGVLVENQGDAAIDTTQLQGVFTSNLKPISVIRRSGPTVDDMRTATTSARIEGQRVVFDKFDQFGPETKHEYQVTAEVVSAGPGNFEVTEITGPVVKKNTPITATAQ